MANRLRQAGIWLLVAQDGKDILKSGAIYRAEGMRLRDAIRHAEICGGDEDP